jgi:hypothetical protein
MTGSVSTQWVEEVLAQHRHLQSEIAELEEFLGQPRPAPDEPGSHTWAVELSRRLLVLHDELFRHFRYEEEAEGKQSLLEKHPEVARRLEEILAEHASLLREVRQIVSDVLAYSEGADPVDSALRRRIGAVLERFHQHEREENQLFQRVEYRDVGGAD